MTAPVYEVTDAMLASIRVLFRRDDSLCLYGIPYDMRPGQSPGDIWRASKAYRPRASIYEMQAPHRDWTSDWIWLGSPGWFGSMSPEAIVRVKAWLAERKAKDEIPGGPFEWNPITCTGATP